MEEVSWEMESDRSVTRAYAAKGESTLSRADARASFAISRRRGSRAMA
jgi:hypothetical protein